MRIDRINNHLNFISTLAIAHFDLWGSLTSRDSLQEYERLLHTAAASGDLPVTLIAIEGSEVLGSVNILERDLPLRPELTPWLAQLFVFPKFRNKGVAAALVKAAVAEAQKLGWVTIYLYTSGTLPDFYERLGWQREEEVEYRGKMRVVMACGKAV